MIRTEKLSNGREVPAVDTEEEWDEFIRSIPRDEMLPLYIVRKQTIFKLDLPTETYMSDAMTFDMEDYEMEEEPPWRSESLSLFAFQWIHVIEDQFGQTLHPIQISANKDSTDGAKQYRLFLDKAKEVQYEAYKLYNQIMQTEQKKLDAWRRETSPDFMEVVRRAEQFRDTTREIVFEEVILPMGHYPEEKLKLIERDLL